MMMIKMPHRNLAGIFPSLCHLIFFFFCWAPLLTTTSSLSQYGENDLNNHHNDNDNDLVTVVGDGWLSCQDFKETRSLANCLCQVTEDGLHFRVNCDHVLFSQDFPPLPFRQPIIHFSQKYAHHQNIPPQALLASRVPLQSLDLSHNLLRRLTEKALEGLSESLQYLDLSFNLLGDQLNPIFSTSEFQRLPRLKLLKLSSNLLFDIDGGILDGALSLQELHLDHNDLRKVPKASLKGPNMMRILNLSFNRIDDLSSDDFSFQPSLLVLNMSNNILTTIQGNAFRGMSNLKIVDLSYNRLERLNSDSFIGLSTVEALDLSYNFLSQIPVPALRSLSSLRGLRLVGNSIQNLQGINLKSLDMLQKLDLSRNRINEIPVGFFSGMHRLREINLGVNQLRTMPSNVFEGLRNLERLNLMDNNLLTFPSAALDPLVSTLSTLTLDYNRISALVPMRLQNLTRLSLSNNLIREIPSETFSNFPQLTHLNLHGNLIESLDEIFLPSTLKNLNLGLNHLKTVPRFPLPNLEVLNLRKNSLTPILQHNFVLLANLQKLDLSSNLIGTFFPNSFDGLQNLEELDLSSNKIEILPKFGNFPRLTRLNFSMNQVKDFVGGMENMENLRVLDLAHNSIGNLQPDIFFNMTNLEKINLQHNKLTSFKGFQGGFSSSFDKLKSVNLAHNQISYVYPNSFENFRQLWTINLAQNRFTLFPTDFLKNCKNLRAINLRANQIKNLNEMNFSNFPHLRKLILSENFIEFVPQNSFLNSSQLQYLDMSSNKLESLDGNMFHGLLRLELDLSNNYLASLPAGIFDRMHVQRLFGVNLSKNTFSAIPSEALQKQYFYLEHLNMSDNQVKEVAQNLNILVNVKTLDLSKNPIDENSLKTILNEPKTVRHLSLAGTGLRRLPILEMPFLRYLDLSGNLLNGFDEAVFKRTTLLHTLLLMKNNFVTLDSNFPASLTHLDLSGNPLVGVSGSSFPQNLQILQLNDLENVIKVEKSALNLKNLITLQLYNLPKLGYFDIRGLLTNLNYLENFDFEVKDHQIVDQIHPGLNSRVKNIGLRGRRVRSISTGAFAGLTSPNVKISLINTSLTILPSILVPVPQSLDINLNLNGTKLTNLNPSFLYPNIRLEGFTPTCDCNAINLIKYLKSSENSAEIFCAAPKNLAGRSVLTVSQEELTCEQGGSTTPPPIVIPTAITTTTTTTFNNHNNVNTPSSNDDIIWSLPPPTKTTKNLSSSSKSKNSGGSDNNKIETATTTSSTKLRPQDINNMDNLIIGIVGSVVALIVLFVFMIVCFVKISSGGNGSGGNEHDMYPAAAPSVISVAPGHYGGPGSKCTCPYSHSPHKGNGSPIYMPGLPPTGPATYSTVRSGGHAGGGKIVQGYPSLPAIYGVHGGGGIHGPYSHYGGSTMGHSSMRQQQQIYASLPYFLPDDYERR